MATPEHDKDYYILADYYTFTNDGVIINARSAQIITVDAEMDADEVEDLVEYHYDDLHALSIIPTLKFLPEVTHKPVDVSELLTNLASDTSYVLSPAEREALLDLRDELPWAPTHVSVNDGSPARVVSQTDETLTLVNEDGDEWADPSSAWAPL